LLATVSLGSKQASIFRFITTLISIGALSLFDLKVRSVLREFWTISPFETSVCFFVAAAQARSLEQRAKT
jgi:hypothetical protein